MTVAWVRRFPVISDRTEQVYPARMIEEQFRLVVADELRDSARERAVLGTESGPDAFAC